MCKYTYNPKKRNYTYDVNGKVLCEPDICPNAPATCAGLEAIDSEARGIVVRFRNLGVPECVDANDEGLEVI